MNGALQQDEKNAFGGERRKTNFSSIRISCFPHEQRNHGGKKESYIHDSLKYKIRRENHHGCMGK